MHDPIRIGLVGCGTIGQHHAAAIGRCDNAELVAVADLAPDAAQKLAAEHGVQHAKTDAKSLLDQADIDAIILALPAGVRSDLAVAALTAGKHVLLEKPVATTLTDCQKIRCAQADRTVGVCSARFSLIESAVAARHIVASGELGQIRIVRCRGLESAQQIPDHPPPAWRLSHKLNGGGILVNWGSYDLDYLMSITGWKLRPRHVLGQTWPCPDHLIARIAPDSDAEAHAAATVLCDGGEIIQIERGEFLPLDIDLAWQITGELGSLRLRMAGHPDRPAATLDLADTHSGWFTKVVVDEPDESNTTDLVVDDFVAALRENRPPQTTLDQAMIIIQITDAIYRSSESGHPVEVTPL